MADRARIAVIGTGWWATTAHLPALQANPDADVAALADLRGDLLGKAADHFGVERAYTDYRAMLAEERLDGAVIAVWHAAHYEVARACLLLVSPLSSYVHGVALAVDGGELTR